MSNLEEKLFKSCLDHLIDAFAIYKAVFNQDDEIVDFQIQYVNNAACEFFHRPYEEIIGTNLLGACPEVTTCFFNELCYVVKTGEPCQRIHENYQIELYHVSSAKRDHSVAVSWRNITENRRLEQELKMQNDKYRTAIEYQTEMVCHALLDTTITYANPAYCNFFGVDQQEIVGKRWIEFYPNEQWPVLQKIWDDLYSNPTRIVRDVTAIKGADGQLHWIEWIDRSIVNSKGEIIEVQGVGRDLTAQKKLEETLKNSDKEHRVLLDSIPCLVFRLDREGKIKFVNQFAKKFFGNPEKQLVGMPILQNVIPVKDAEQTYKMLNQILEDGRKVHKKSLVSEYHLPNGKHCWVQWNFRKYTNPISGLPGILCLGFDISEQRKAEVAIAKVYERRNRTTVFNKILRDEISGGELSAILQRAGIFISSQIILFVIQIEGVLDGRKIILPSKEGQREQARIDALIDEISSLAVAWQPTEGIAILLNGIISEKEKIAEQCVKLTQNKFPGKKVFMGIAEINDTPPDISTAYRQAIFAIKAGLLLQNESPIFYWKDLGMIQLLLNSWNTKMSQSFINREIGALVEHDKKRNDALVDTLLAILTADSIVSVANRLHVHEKTVLFRKKKIEKVLGYSVGKWEKRISLLSAIWMFRLRDTAEFDRGERV